MKKEPKALSSTTKPGGETRAEEEKKIYNSTLSL